MTTTEEARKDEMHALGNELHKAVKEVFARYPDFSGMLVAVASIDDLTLTTGMLEGKLADGKTNPESWSIDILRHITILKAHAGETRLGICRMLARGDEMKARIFECACDNANKELRGKEHEGEE